MNISEHESWTVYAPAVCTCADARIGSIRAKGVGRKPVFILEFIIHDTGQAVTKFYNVKITPKGNYAATHNGDFAKQHRLVTGKYNKARYSRARQLLKDMVGHDYIVEYEVAESSQNKSYLKATKVNPVNSIITEQWFESGLLRPKKRSPNDHRLANRNKATVKQRTSNNVAIERQKVSKLLAMNKPQEPHLDLDSSVISIPLKHTTLKHNHVEPYTHISVEDDSTNDTEYKTTMREVGGVRVFQYYRHPDETLDQYHDRVIEESWGV
mgnify:CR=1 FL=1